MTKKVLILVVSYNAQNLLADKVLERIPEKVWENKDYKSHVLVLDDSSQDNTFIEGHEYKNKHKRDNLTVLCNPVNLGYGGNQKLGYHYAVEENFDIVALLHGDGQYAPQLLPTLLQPLLNEEADAVFGSRILNPGAAIKGGMPLYKYIGNRILTTTQNKILGSKLSEFHSGYRLYSVKALASIPFNQNSNDFDFDTDIIIQMLQMNYHIKEIAIPTHYGDEVCHVNGVKYAYNIIISSLLSQCQKLGIFYHPKFHMIRPDLAYETKFGYSSSHQMAYDIVQTEEKVLYFGVDDGKVAVKLQEKCKEITVVSQYLKPLTQNSEWQKSSPEQFSLENTHNFDKVLLIDIISHLSGQESFLQKLRRQCYNSKLQVLVTTGNISFIIPRIMMLFGFFNYSKVGILDNQHKKLYNLSTLKRCLELSGYNIHKTFGLPVPFPKAFGDNWFSRLLLKINHLLIKIWPSLFSYQIAIIAQPTPTLPFLLEQAFAEKERRLASE